jgi:methylglyoxal synthase
MRTVKNIALVAHDNRKKDLLEWVSWNCRTLLNHRLVCTGTTGKLVERTLNTKPDLDDSHRRQQVMRIAVVYNIPIACNRSTADFMISSPLMDEEYEPVVKDYSDYINRTYS